ncbi:MAG: hypothetical protein CME60_08785 [Halobacteriovoraceae bacterium]|nr:hypothetical protein [Halobacteriovoraceae bacterium]
MHFNGVKSLKVSSFTIGFLLLTSVYAEDFGIAVPGQLSEDHFERQQKKSEKKKKEEGFSYVMGEGNGKDLSQTDENDYQPDQSPAFSVPGDGNNDLKLNISENDKLLSTGYKAPHSLENEENLVSFEGDELYDNFYDNGDSAFSFTYIQDDYNVSDSRGVFQRSFVDAEDSRRGGYLHLNFDRFINRAFLSTFYGVGLGVGFSEGEGIFSDSTSTKSNVTFQLFTIPVDMRLGMTIGRGKYFKLSVAGGPSVMGISQSRDDKERGEDEKHRRQYSFGYFGQAKAQISLSALFKDLAMGGFSQYQMTNMYLNLEARHQSYENFEDDISITGTSFGLGFTFEYL